MAPETDYYQLFSLAPTCSVDEVKKAYRKQALKHHPDKGGDKALFALYLEAKETLMDPEKRRKYDLTRQTSASTAAARTAFSHNFSNTRRSSPKPRTYKSTAKAGFYDDPRSNSSSSKHNSWRSYDRTYNANPFQSPRTKPRNTYTEKRQTFENMFSRGARGFGSKRERPSAPQPPPNPKSKSKSKSSFSSWGLYDSESSSGDEGENQEPMGGGTSSNGVKPESYTQTDMPHEDPLHSFGFGFQTNNYHTNTAPGYVFEEPLEEEVEEEFENTRRHFTQSFKQRSAFPDQQEEEQEEEQEMEQGEDGISEDEEEPTTAEDEENIKTEFVDLTNESDEEEQEEQEPLPNKRPFFDDYENVKIPKTTNDHPVEEKTTTGKRQPELESEDDEELELDGSKSPKKRAKTSAYETLKDDIFSTGPFTETHGDFNMDSMFESIAGSSAPKRPKNRERERAEFVLPNGRRRGVPPKFNTTSTPVNMERPIYCPPRKEFELGDDIDALQLNAPIPPSAPDLSTVTNSILEYYSDMIGKYQNQWNVYNHKMNVYQQRRVEADARYGLELFQTSQGLKEYMAALRHDAKVKALWSTAYDTHIRVMNEFIAVKDYVESHK